MSYEKQNWESGQTITAEKLNHIENGIASTGGVLIVHEIEENNRFRLDKTWQQIADAEFAVLNREEDGNNILILTGYGHYDESYTVGFYDFIGQENNMYSIDSADGYPVPFR